MPTILRTERKDYGGVEVFCAGDDCPVYLAPHLLKTHWDGAKLTPTGVAFCDAVLVQRVAGRVVAAKEASIDAAIQAELQKRRDAVPDLKDRTPADAVKAIWPTTAEVAK